MKTRAKSNAYTLSKEAFRKVFDGLKKAYHIFGPTIKKGQGLYSDTDLCVYDRLTSFDDLAFKNRTYFSAKEAAFPISERLLELAPNGLREPKTAPQKKIIFARSCDIEGFLRLDKIYLHNGPLADFYYKRLRSAIHFFLIECAEGFDGCFCQSVGSNVTEEYVVSVREMGEEFSVIVNEESFDEWFDIQDSEIDRQGKRLRGKGAPQHRVPIPDLNKRELLEDHIWEEYVKRCIGCGRCNAVCPTCSCFGIYDALDDKGNRVRKRIWAGCQIDGFGKVAGGHEYRVDKGARMRYKIFHKFRDFKDRFGQHMCVGCGRCVEACPEYIDIRETLRKLDHG